MRERGGEAAGPHARRRARRAPCDRRPAGGRRARGAIVLLGLLLGAAGLAAEAPVAVSVPRRARAELVLAAEGYEGVPYRYGGSDRGGFDCSGLVYRVYLQTISVALPRTAATLYRFSERIERGELQPGDLVFFDTDGPLAHVGIYAGEERFIHAASEGPSKGVIESSLGEAYWARTYAGAGRIIPPAGYLGLVASAAIGPDFGTGPYLRGVSAEAGLSYRVLGLDLGLQARPSYDGTLGVLRLPAVLWVGLGKDLGFFVGPSFTLGAPKLGHGADERRYEPAGGLAATAGAAWTPIRFKLSGYDVGLYAELVYNRYVPRAGSPSDPLADAAATIKAGAGLRLRWGL